MKKLFKKEKGITLIALVVTIIILLILSGISVSMLSGENGIINRASEANFKTELATVKEEFDLFKTKELSNTNTINKLEFDMPIWDYILGYESYKSNCRQMIFVLQEVDDYLINDGISSILERIKELVNQLFDDRYGDTDKQHNIMEIQELQQEIQRMKTDGIKWGNNNLNDNVTFKCYYDNEKYIEIELKDCSCEGLGLLIDDLSTEDNRINALNSVNNAIAIISEYISNNDKTIKKLTDVIEELDKKIDEII